MNAPIITHTELSGIDEALKRGHTALCRDIKGSRKVALMELSSGAVKILTQRLSPRDIQREFDFSNYSCFSVNVPLSAGVTNNREMDTEYFSRNILPYIWQVCHDAEKHGVTDIYAVATATYRQIINRDEILEMITRDCGLNVAVLSASEEACGVANAINMSLPDSKFPTIIIDHGKCSTEITVLTPSGSMSVLSLDFGLTHLLKDCALHLASGINMAEYMSSLDVRLESSMREYIVELMGDIDTESCRVIAIGTPVTLSTGIKGSRNYHGLTLTLHELQQSRHQGLSFSGTDMHREENMQQYVGLAPYMSLLRLLGLKCLTVSGTSLWYGALHRALMFPFH